LAHLVIRLAGNDKVKVLYKEKRPGDVVHSLADISRAGSFGYRPKYNLEDGLKEAFFYLKSKANKE